MEEVGGKNYPNALSEFKAFVKENPTKFANTENAITAYGEKLKKECDVKYPENMLNRIFEIRDRK